MGTNTPDEIMYRMTQQHVDLSVISDSLSLSDDSVKEVGVITRTIDNFSEDDEIADVTPDVKPTPPTSPASLEPSSSPDMFEEDDTELLPADIKDKMYKFVKTFSTEELMEIGNMHGFFCSGKVSKDKILQSKAYRQTISVYLTTSTVRLQPGGENYETETIFNCNAKELAWMMIDVKVVETGAKVKERRSQSASARSLSLIHI